VGGFRSSALGHLARVPMKWSISSERYDALVPATLGMYVKRAFLDMVVFCGSRNPKASITSGRSAL
jgi:hypothetical protein